MKINRNIAFFSNSIGMGGAEKALSKIVNSKIWGKNNYKINLIFNQRAKEHELEIKNIFDPSVAINFLSDNLTLKNPLKTKKLLDSVIDSLKIKCVFTLMTGMSRNLLWYKFFKKTDLKVITMERNNPLGLYYGNRIKQLLYYFEFKLIYKNADGVISNSKELSNLYEHMYGNEGCKYYCIGNPIDFSALDQKISQNSVEKIQNKYKEIFSSPFMLNVGRLEIQKDHSFLINQFSKIKNLVHHNLVILGSGSQKDALLKQIESLGLKDRVFIIEYESNPYPFFEFCDLFLLTSKWEGMPNVILECLHFNKKVLSLNTDFGPRELAKEFANIHILDNSHKEDFYLRILEVLSAEQIDDTSRVAKLKNFDLENIALRYVEFANQIMSKK